MKRYTVTAALSLAALVATVSARAETVAYQRVPLHNVLSQLQSRYGLNIVLKGRLRYETEHPVTFNVGNPDTKTTRLQIMNALSNAEGVDFQKGFVVSKASPNQTRPPVQIDTNAFLILKSKRMSAQQAITLVAGTDNATIQIATNVTGDVTFSSTTLRAAQAAREIAEQTQTVWHAYYALTPENMMASGKLPLTIYDTTPPAPAKTASVPTTTPKGTLPGTAPGAPEIATTPDQGADVTDIPYQYAPSMDDGYGDNGYGYDGGYGGYGGYGGGTYGLGGGGVTVLPGSGGYGPFGGYGGPPVSFP
jgi:hypothetical protein